jgi:flavin-dependent dehydrogenase
MHDVCGRRAVTVVVGGGAAGVYASIHAKSAVPMLNVLIVENGKFLVCLHFNSTDITLWSQVIAFLLLRIHFIVKLHVMIFGGGRCNVSNGHFYEPVARSKGRDLGFLCWREQEAKEETRTL